jgi:hypothetical protein
VTGPICGALGSSGGLPAARKQVIDMSVKDSTSSGPDRRADGLASEPNAGVGRPVSPSTGVLQPLGLRETTLTGGFWGHSRD